MKFIDSVNNPYIKDLAKLQMKKIVISQGKYLVEGKNVITEAIAAGVVETILVTDESLYADAPVHRILVSEPVISKLNTNVSNEGAIAVCNIVEPVFDINAFNKVIVLDSINNPGNFGTIIRTAKALGYDAVITLGNSVFKWNSKVISGAQGAIFSFPVIQMHNYDHGLMHKPYFFTLDEEAKTLEAVKPEGKFALVFGNEANGITEDLISSWAGEKVFIPIEGVESLSLASAASIAMYALKGN